jgi:transcriptional regulator with XRE-family HTH domain
VNGNHFKLKRIESGLTQQRLAALVGCPESAISRYETQRATPPEEVKSRLTAILGGDPLLMFPRRGAK